jgi:hypothetical protein
MLHLSLVCVVSTKFVVERLPYLPMMLRLLSHRSISSSCYLQASD